MDSIGNMYVTERTDINLYDNSRTNPFSGVRMITPNGTVTTLTGYYGNTGNTDGSYNTAQTGWLIGIAVSPTAIYVSDYSNNVIRKISCGGNCFFF